MQIPGGWLGQRFGGTRVFGICLGIASVLTMLTPIAARTSVAALITLRVIEGLALVSEQITGRKTSSLADIRGYKKISLLALLKARVHPSGLARLSFHLFNAAF